MDAMGKTGITSMNTAQNVDNPAVKGFPSTDSAENMDTTGKKIKSSIFVNL